MTTVKKGLSLEDFGRATGIERPKSAPEEGLDDAVNAELQAAEVEPADEVFEPEPVPPAPKKKRAKKAKAVDEGPARPSLSDLQTQILSLVGPLMDAEDAGDEERVAQLAAELDALGYDLDTKADGYVHVIRRFEALAAERKRAAADLAEMARADENRAKRIKARLMEALAALDQDTAGHLHRVTLVAPMTTKLELVGDEADIPGRYLETVTTTRPNKAAIKDALERGEALPFARLERVAPHLRIK